MILFIVTGYSPWIVHVMTLTLGYTSQLLFLTANEQANNHPICRPGCCYIWRSTSFVNSSLRIFVMFSVITIVVPFNFRLSTEMSFRDVVLTMTALGLLLSSLVCRPSRCHRLMSFRSIGRSNLCGPILLEISGSFIDRIAPDCLSRSVPFCFDVRGRRYARAMCRISHISHTTNTFLQLYK